MAKFLTSIIVLTSLIFTSCSSNESIDEITTLGSQQMLKTYTLSKDANGNYSIDYEVSDYTAVNAVTDAETNSTEFHLKSGNIATEKRSNKSLIFVDDSLEVSFYEGETITGGLLVEDDAETEHLFLESYSIQDLGNDTYQVDFKVKDGVAVAFDYNVDENIYEIHLSTGEATTKEFSKTFVKNYDVLKVDFVNYLGSGKSAKAASNSYEKPRLLSLS